ncbi:MAG: DNA polymerase III subunit gamma and tau [Microbacteriaceae bacterium]
MVTALYRRYRPETFAELIGQSQVTDPLMTALRTNRVNHAYLFSGPRGCGKTTSARILARCLNCAEGPTDTPCGKCASCIELSRDGAGSLDVVEIDAASHNGVDDARDLRERAIFAPARDRYKIFILDEAHMVTPQGFNALLKIVEEPPEHVKFIFATTEPDKVIGTIRSRTHHYPFRLIPPAQMLPYVQGVCDSEQVTVAPGVLPLVVRAGGGSARDTLSLLDQLMAGSENATVDYERAVALLGYTHAALLDEVVDAIAARDAAGAFAAVDRVIQTGQDPRRFVEDLLERLRDLIIVAATSAEGAAAVLRGVPQDELDRMAVQSSKFGQAELSRCADIVNAALSEMTGATSPRLHLELMIARMLVPAVDDSRRGTLARVERLERRVGVEPVAAAASGATASGAAASSASIPPVAEPAEAPTAAVPASLAPQVAEPAEASVRSTEPTSSVTEAGEASAPSVAPATVQQVKDAWPQVLDAVQNAKRAAWTVLVTARVLELRAGNVLVLSFPSRRDVEALKHKAASEPGVGDYLKQAVVDVLGFRPSLMAKVEDTAASRRPPEAGAGTDAGHHQPIAPVPMTQWATVAVPGSAVPGDELAVAEPPVADPAEAEPPVAELADDPWAERELPPEDVGGEPGMGETVPTTRGGREPVASEPAASEPAPSEPGPSEPAAEHHVAFQAPQRYGESVVRELLGAHFIEEQPAQPGIR